MGVQDRRWKKFKRHLIDFIGTHAGKALPDGSYGNRAQCTPPSLPEPRWRMWNSEAQIDVAGDQDDGKDPDPGECASGTDIQSILAC